MKLVSVILLFLGCLATAAPLAAESDSSLSATASRSILKNFNQGECLRLQDGSYWKINPLDQDKVSYWNAGDSVSLVASGELNFTIKIINTSLQNTAYAAPHAEPSLQEHTLISVFHNGSFIRLTDGSFFEINPLCCSSVFAYWNAGDIIDVLYSEEHSYPYQFLNRSCGSDVCGQLIRGPSTVTLTCAGSPYGGARLIQTSNKCTWEIRTDNRPTTFCSWYTGDTLEVGFSDDAAYPYKILNTIRDEIVYAKIVGYSGRPEDRIALIVQQGEYLKLANGSWWHVKQSDISSISSWWSCWQQKDATNLIYDFLRQNDEYPYKLHNRKQQSTVFVKLIALHSRAYTCIRNFEPGGNVKLADGTLWSVSFSDKTHTWWWCAGDPIDVIECDQPNFPFKLINTKRSTVANACLTR